MSPTVSVVVVDYGHHEALPGLVAALRSQTLPPDQIVVVENDPQRRAAAMVEATAPDVTLVVPDENGGFAGGCDDGAAVAHGDLLLFLNPDTAPEPTLVEHLVDVLARRPAAGIVGAQVLVGDGTATNAGANPLHPTGIVWSGGLGEPPEDGPERRTMTVSGAALMVRRRLFAALGGFEREYFLYHEDVDLCWRARLAGAEVWFCPRARLRHDYEFEKRDKWFYLERNRAWTVLSAYETRTLAAVLPLLAATEAAVCLSAVRAGWWPQKRRAYAAVWRRRRWLLARRRGVQSSRRIADAALWPELTPRISSPVLDGPLLRAANPLVGAYVAVVGAMLGASRRPRP